MNQTESALEALEGIYTQYACDYARAEAEAPVTGGLLGMGDSPKNAPCHQIFYDALGRWAAAFAAAPAAGEVYPAVERILKAADRCRDTGVYWYCYAAQGHAEALIGLLDPEEARQLQQWYDSAYPALDRMPVQKKIYRLLKKQAKQRQTLFW